MIYILNDNTMSISPRVGGIATHLARLSSSSAYNWLKKAIKTRIPAQGQVIENVLGKMKDHIKTIVKPINIFDEMDINYWGPFDATTWRRWSTSSNWQKNTTARCLFT